MSPHTRFLAVVGLLSLLAAEPAAAQTRRHLLAGGIIAWLWVIFSAWLAGVVKFRVLALMLRGRLMLVGALELITLIACLMFTGVVDSYVGGPEGRGWDVHRGWGVYLVYLPSALIYFVAATLANLLLLGRALAIGRAALVALIFPAIAILPWLIFAAFPFLMSW